MKKTNRQQAVTIAFFSLALCFPLTSCSSLDPSPLTPDASTKDTMGDTTGEHDGTGTKPTGTDSSSDELTVTDSSRTTCPSPATRALPIVVKGEDVPDLLGAPVDRVIAYRFGDTWEQVPVQIDERKVVDWAGEFIFYVFPDNGSGNVFNEDDDPSLDENDEIALPFDAPGAEAPSQTSWPQGTQGEPVVLHVQDQIQGTQGVIYLFKSTTSVIHKADDVSYDRFTCKDAPSRFGGGCSKPWGPDLEDTTIETPCYRMHFAMNYVLDVFTVKTQAGGTDEDLIDRWKGRAFSTDHEKPFGPPNAEHEDHALKVFLEKGVAALCLGWSKTDNLHYYVGHIDGPVRAIRMAKGACSYSNMVRTWTFSRSAIVERIYLRGHAIPLQSGGVGFYWDYNQAAMPLTYYRSEHPSGVTFDGQRDFGKEVNRKILNDSELTHGFYEQTSSAKGGMLFYTKQIKPPPPGEGENAIAPIVRLYMIDDSSFNDGTGDEPGVIGGHGIRFAALPKTENNPAIFENTYRPIPANSENAGTVFKNLMQTPPEILVD